MKINVSAIQREIGAAKEFDDKLVLNQLDYQHEQIIFKEPVQVWGSIINRGELVLNASVKGSVTLMCGYCMEEYDHILDFSFEARLVKGPAVEDQDTFTYQGDMIELTDIVVEFLLLELPIKRKCKESCRGICPMCGIDLNSNQCQCSTMDNYFST